MTASALTRPGERDRPSSKLAELDWRGIGRPVPGPALFGAVFARAARLEVRMDRLAWRLQLVQALYAGRFVWALLVEVTGWGQPAGAGLTWLALGGGGLQVAELVKSGV